MQKFGWALLATFVAVLFTLPAAAEDNNNMGKLRVQVSPRQAYVFVDGKAIGDGSRTIDLPAGQHKLAIRNYGFVPNVEDINIVAGEKAFRHIVLQPTGDRVSGPFGEIELKGHPRADVLLNGQTPDYFVGHVDEFDWNWLVHQRLLVQPGTYQVTATRKGNTIWSGQVPVKAGQRVIVYLNDNGKTKVRNWGEGLSLGPQRRFNAGIANTTVAVAPATAQLSAASSNLNCGQPTDLKWQAADAVDTSISGIGQVPAQGDHEIMPKTNTTYVLIAKGPGGETQKAVTVGVNQEPITSLSASRLEVNYHKIGDKVVHQDPTILKWSVSNASSAKIDPLGQEALHGSKTITPSPKQTIDGPVDEYLTYTLTAANGCGGTATRSAILHLTGSIDPPPAITLGSVFYPTAYPTKKRPKVGLVKDEQEALMTLVNQFNNHDQYEHQAHLVIVGHADFRGSVKYNDALSLRRAELVRSYLVSQGIPADKMQVRAEGKSHELSKIRVAALQSKDPQKPEKWMKHNRTSTWLAYNRRADIVLRPEGQASAEMYPNDVPEARILWQQREPSLQRVEMAGKAPASNLATRASTAGN